MDEQSIVKRRKRAHDSESHKRKLNKRKRMAGLEYVGFSTKNRKIKQDKVRNARGMGPRCSSKFCQKTKLRHCEKFNESTRSKIFRSFWNLPLWSSKQILIQGLVKGVKVIVPRTTESRRKETFKYFLYLNGTAVQVFIL